LTNPKFICRLHYPSNYNVTVGEISNFEGIGNRQEDEIVVFNGMFGLDGYMMLYLHQTLPSFDFTKVIFEVRLYLDGNIKNLYYSNSYRHVSTRFDAESGRYVVIGIDEDSAMLQTKLTDKKISSLSYFNTTMHPRDIFINILQDYDIFNVDYDYHPFEDLFDIIQYRYFDINTEWRVLDFINYICDENKFEWAVRHMTFHVGVEIRAFKSRRVGRDVNEEKDRISRTPFFLTIDGEARPCDLFSNYDEAYKCIWVKHYVGKSGGSTTACFTKIGKGSIDKRQYFTSLQGGYEKTNASLLLMLHNSPSHYVKLGRTIIDSGTVKTTDLVSTHKEKISEKVTDLASINFVDGSSQSEPFKYFKDTISKSTPYLDHRAGLSFPVPWLYDGPDFSGQIGAPVEEYRKKAPNQLVFNVEGREELGVLGNYLFGSGNEKDFIIPTKRDARDFRLTLKGLSLWDLDSTITVCPKCGGKLILKWFRIDLDNRIQIYQCTTCKWYIPKDDVRPKFYIEKEYGANIYFDHSYNILSLESKELYMRAEFTPAHEKYGAGTGLTSEYAWKGYRDPRWDYWGDLSIRNTGSIVLGNARTIMEFFDAGCLDIEAVREAFYHSNPDKVKEDNPTSINRGQFKLYFDNGNGEIHGQANREIKFHTRKWLDVEATDVGESAGWQPYEAVSFKVMELSSPGPRFIIDMDEDYGDRNLNLYNIADNGGLQDGLGLYMYSKGSALTDNANYIKLKITDDIYLIINGDGTATLDVNGGTIDINSNGGTINIGANASEVNLAGGGNKISHADHTHGYAHTHIVGNMGIPIPGTVGLITHVPQEDTPIVVTDEHKESQGSSITEVD